jgi:hypothetical protein
MQTSVVSKLKCPLFVASEMSGFVNLPQPSGRWGCPIKGDVE